MDNVINRPGTLLELECKRLMKMLLLRDADSILRGDKQVIYLQGDYGLITITVKVAIVTEEETRL